MKKEVNKAKKRPAPETKKKVTNEEVLEATLNLAHEIRHIAQSLGIPREKIIS